MEGVQDAAQPGFLTVATQEMQGTAVGLAATQGLLQSAAVFLVADVRRNEVRQGASQHIRGAHAHLLFEVGVHGGDAPAAIQFQAQHFHVELGLQPLEGVHLLAEALQFLF